MYNIIKYQDKDTKLYFSKDYKNFSYNYIQFINAVIRKNLINIRNGKEIDDIKKQRNSLLKFRWLEDSSESEKLLKYLE